MRAQTVQEIYRQFPDVDGLWDFNDFHSTEITLQNALNDSPESRAPFDTIRLLTQLSRVQNILENPTGAMESLKSAGLLASGLSASEEKTKAEIKINLEHGRHLWLARNPARAQSYLNQAWTLSNSIGYDFCSIDAALMLAITQPPKYQNEWMNKAIVIAEKSNDPNAKLWLSHLYMLKGWALFDFHRFEEALQNFSAALKRPRERGETSNVSYIRWSIARTLRNLNKIHEALDIQNSLRIEFSIEGKVNGYVFLEIAECMQLLQKIDEAKEFFELAYKELSLNGWYSDNRSAELNRMQFLYKKHK